MDRIKRALRYFHTLRYLKLIQIYGQIKFRLHKPAFTHRPAPSVRAQSAKWILPVAKNKNAFTPTIATFLNQEKDISSADIWDDKNIDKLWLYNLHYFDLLNSDTDVETQLHFIKRWITENPPKHNSNGWEPYTLSLRVVNWIKWLALQTNPDKSILQSLATQVRYLSKRLEIHIQGNHLLANIKALLFAGCYFAGSEADSWFDTGLKYFKRELKKQILKDGGHFELSPLYHSIILEDFLDVINLFITYGKTIPSSWFDIINNMFSWLATMSHPDGNIAFFNDTTLGIASPYSALDDYRKRLSLNADTNTTFSALTYLSHSGYARLQKDKAVILTDIARAGPSYQPGHAHADTLSFELSLDQQRVLVNTGISTYNDNDMRRMQRGTGAHNTLQINDSDSSEVWKSFRLARRAKVFNIKAEEQPEQIFIRACHNGYYHSYKVIHSRIWQLSKKQLLIIDDVTGKMEHKVALHFHLHPAIKTEQTNNEIKLYDAADNHLATMQATHPLKLIESTYHPEFNRTIVNKKILIETLTALPQRFETLITWN